jgi:hypothetical protein
LQAEDPQQPVTLEEMQEFQVQMYANRLQFMREIDTQLNDLKQGNPVDPQKVIDTIQTNSEQQFGATDYKCGVEMVLNELLIYVHTTEISKQEISINISNVIHGLSNILYGGNSQ